MYTYRPRHLRSQAYINQILQSILFRHFCFFLHRVLDPEKYCSELILNPFLKVFCFSLQNMFVIYYEKAESHSYVASFLRNLYWAMETLVEPSPVIVHVQYVYSIVRK